ncbi:MAG: hypothetical protein ABWY50_08755, partial [Aeromicrobium sp.]
GISAAVMMAEVAATAKAAGETLQQRLDVIADRYGRHVTREHSIKMDPAVGAAAVAAVIAAVLGLVLLRSPSEQPLE